jgi:hypothetical protein
VRADLAELQQRRERLTARCAELRQAIAASGEPLAAKAAAADRLLSAARNHRLTATLVGGAAIALASRANLASVARILSIYALLKRI